MLLKLDLQKFAPAIAFITINFDSHISKVTYSGVEWTASGQSQQTAIVDGSTGVFTVTLDSGYVLDTVTLGSDFDNTTLSAKTDTSFSLLFGNTAGGTITITSKQSSSSTKLIKIKFKDTIKTTSNPQTINISFTSNGKTYSGIQYIDTPALRYLFTGDYDQAYFDDSWTNNNFKIIEIDPTQTNFQAFITAMKSNIQGVELEAGTYKWNDVPEKSFIKEVRYNIEFNFGTQISFDEALMQYYSNVWNTAYSFSRKIWANDSYKTITTTADQYIDYDFYNYAILGNQLVKQTAPTTGETWLLNEFNGNLTASAIDVNVQFTSNNANYTRFRCVKGDPFSTGIYYDGVQVWNSSDDYTNQAYRTINFATPPTGNLLTWLQANGTKQGSAPTYSFKHWKKSNVVVNRTLVGQKYYYFKPYTILGLYRIDTTLNNCTGASANATKIQENGGLTLTFTANSGYELPTGVSVTNVTSYNWNKSTGVLAISKPTGDVTIEIVAVSALPQLSTPTNVAVTDTTLTFDEVANATSYEVFVDNVSIGTHTIASGETWLLNESLGMDALSKTNVTFKSNNEDFVGIACSTSSMGPQTLWYYKNDTEYVVACEYGTYSNQAYRTLVLDKPATGNLLTWLNANGTRQ